MDHRTEVGGLCIARTADIEFLLYEILRLEGHLTLGIADTDHTAREGHLVDGHLIGRHTAHSLDHHIWTEATGQLLQTSMGIFGLGIHGISRTHLLGQGQFLIVDVGSDDSGTTQGRTHHGTHSHHTATNDHHYINIGHLSTVYSMETHAHRLYQRTSTGIKPFGRNHLLPGQHEQFAHGTPALHAERFIMLTGIYTAIPT